MQKLLTIVVPVYKVEQYIKKCLDSCLVYKADGELDEEMMNKLEVIIVNDGTPDNSAELSREYTVRFPNTFRQIDQENKGHGGAWNTGLKEATGKYLRFLDSDDWLINLSLLMKKLNDCEADLVFTQMDEYLVKTDEFVRWPINGEKDKLYTVDEFPFLETEDSIICDFLYCTYKTSILQPLHPLFDEHIYYDDIILFIAPQMLAKTCIIYDFSLYQYLVGREGQTIDPAVKERNKKFVLKEYDKIVSFYQEHKQNREAINWVQYVIIRFVFNNFLPLLVPNLFFLNYKESSKIAYIVKDAVNITTINLTEYCIIPKLLKRLLRYPYPVFYAIEWVRNVKANIKGMAK